MRRSPPSTRSAHAPGSKRRSRSPPRTRSAHAPGTERMSRSPLGTRSTHAPKSERRGQETQVRITTSRLPLLMVDPPVRGGLLLLRGMIPVRRGLLPLLVHLFPLLVRELRGQLPPLIGQLLALLPQTRSPSLPSLLLNHPRTLQALHKGARLILKRIPRPNHYCAPWSLLLMGRAREGRIEC